MVASVNRPYPSLRIAKRIVVKIGSALLFDAAANGVRTDWLRALAHDIAALRKQEGVQVVIVSSGAIALGCSVLPTPPERMALEFMQAAAAVGQIGLAQSYHNVFQECGITTAQILMTLEDSENRRRYLNVKATLSMLLDLHILPIINENDSTATDEIRYGDNDRLAAQTAVMVSADFLVLLSDIDGLYSHDPHDSKRAQHMPVVGQITPEIRAMAQDTASHLARGGMKTKLLAAETALHAGCTTVITKGLVAHPLLQLTESKARATWFVSENKPIAARKAWISAMKAKGDIVVDKGAMVAVQGGKSLLPSGVVAVRGGFGRGDPVHITNTSGAILGKGLVRYTASEATLIQGCQSQRIESVLGYPGRSVLIHRDDLVLSK